MCEAGSVVLFLVEGKMKAKPRLGTWAGRELIRDALSLQKNSKVMIT